MFAIQTFSGWLTAGLLIAAIAFWWWSTRYLSNIPNKSHARLIRIFRLVTLIGIALLLSDFQVQWTERRKIPPTIAVFVDNSESVARFGPQVKDSASAFRDYAEKPDSKIEMATFGFSNEVQFVGNVSELDLSGSRTDLSSPFQYMSDNRRAKNIHAGLIISDGIHNSGPDPQTLPENWRLPVYTLFIGDTTASRDIKISDFSVPAYAYAGDSITAQITINVQNLSNADTIAVKVQGRSIATDKTLPLPRGDYSKNLSIPFQVSEAGEYQLTAITDSIHGEKNILNNRENGRISVKPGRYTVFLVSETPSMETRFLINAIEELDRFEIVTSFASIAETGPVAGKEEDVDIFYVIGNPSQFNEIEGRTRLDKVIYQVNAEGAIRRQSSADGNGSWTETGGTLRESQDNPLSSLRDQVRFGELPPVWVLNSDPSVNGASLLTAAQNNVPVISTRTQADIRTISIFARDLWRWSFASGSSMESASGSQTNPFKQVMEQLFFWLLRDTDFQRLQVKVNAGANNRIQAEAQVFTPSLAQAEVAKVWGALLDSTGAVLQRNLYSREENRYLLRVNARQGGAYRIRTRAFTANDTLEHTSPPVKIPALNYELLEQKGRPGVLRNISEQSGGRYLQAVSDFNIDDYTDRAVSYQSRQHSFALRRAYWFWALLVILFGIDWWLRRRNGML